VKRREILFTRNAAGNARRAKEGGGESNLVAIIESSSVLPRDLARGIVSIPIPISIADFDVLAINRLSTID